MNTLFLSSKECVGLSVFIFVVPILFFSRTFEQFVFQARNKSNKVTETHNNHHFRPDLPISPSILFGWALATLFIMILSALLVYARLHPNDNAENHIDVVCGEDVSAQDLLRTIFNICINLISLQISSSSKNLSIARNRCAVIPPKSHMITSVSGDYDARHDIHSHLNRRI